MYMIKQKRVIVLILTLTFTMCGGNTNTETNEPAQEAPKIVSANTETNEPAQEAPEIVASNNSDVVTQKSLIPKIENIKSIDYYGTSSHLEIVDESTLRLFYNDFGGVAVFLCSFDFNCKFQGSLQIYN